ncbi:helix-turn-helix domain-containing protein [Natronorubrum thiooxidans]|uniref:Uncharacterized protein n=1 Tax=Natronorubrum thiooxidans TaxID=308853 RepID=A0A1N7C0L4_9EURY|nr:helix-turn-helix domain-containing protein [Natronorubrum thiooxidans]SIR57090.1 hypothetical protein SAMN05421752_10140 [Natronorubrum thiooxidans]
MSGFRATVVVDDPTGCPIADVSSTTDTITSVTRSSASTDGGVVEEFGVADGSSTETVDASTEAELTPIQTTEQEDIYRFERDADAGCACEIIEQTGTPISAVRAQNGSLLLTFRTLDLEVVAEIVGDLRAEFDGVLVEDLTQDQDDESTDPVIVDRELLTTRQREIIEAAHELGYFEYPKGANATDVAEELDIARSTLTEHLAAGQTKLLNAILEK